VDADQWAVGGHWPVGSHGDAVVASDADADRVGFGPSLDGPAGVVAARPVGDERVRLDDLPRFVLEEVPAGSGSGRRSRWRVALSGLVLDPRRRFDATVPERPVRIRLASPVRARPVRRLRRRSLVGLRLPNRGDDAGVHGVRLAERFAEASSVRSTHEIGERPVGGPVDADSQVVSGLALPSLIIPGSIAVGHAAGHRVLLAVSVGRGQQ
jgi:hypothetical protein